MVTNIILTFSILEEEVLVPESRYADKYGYRHALVEHPIKPWLLQHGQHGGLARVDHLAGGHKSMETNVYLGAFNYLPTRQFAVFVYELPWRNPGEVQLWVKEDDDTGFWIAP